MESLIAIARPRRIVALSQHSAMQRLRAARSCYDHLAGRLGVAVTDRVIRQGAISLSKGSFEMTAGGETFFRKLGVDIDAALTSRRTFARACLDWTERRPHLAGSLGASVLENFLLASWVERNKRDRSLRVTPQGRAGFARVLHVSI